MESFVKFFKNEIDAAAGRPSGRRPFITTGGMGASAPISTSTDFNRAEIFKKIPAEPKSIKVR